jgi:hypothetical protein
MCPWHPPVQKKPKKLPDFSNGIFVLKNGWSISMRRAPFC